MVRNISLSKSAFWFQAPISFDAQPGFDQRSNEPIVSFLASTPPGARKFAEATQQNVGKPFGDHSR